jgi:cell division septum initiation protein DivIVA
MTEETLNGQSKKTSEKGKITYSQYGFRSAQKSQSQPAGIDGYLDNVYDQFLEEQKLDEQGLKDRISKLKAELQSEKTKKNDANAEISSHKSFKEDKEKQIEELELEKIDIRNGDGEIGDTSSFVIGAFITLLLTMYLFVFYSSSGYSAFYGIKPGSLGFINPNVFSDAMNKGGGVIALIILFPVIFLAMGFYIHVAIENNKKLNAENKPSKYGIISGLLLITLIADIFIGYKISQGVHTNEFNAGLTNETWKFNMIFSDINFYLVLVLGFVVYVVWGFLLNFVLSHSYLKTESEKVKLMIENVNNKIADKRKELSDIVSKIHKYESDIITCESKIQEKEKDIIGYENGVIPINVASLKGSVGEFMGGWQNYTNNYFTDVNVSIPLNDEAIKAQILWLSNKIQNLNSDN